MSDKQNLWDEAKKKCRLGDEEIRMAKEMGLNPKSLKYPDRPKERPSLREKLERMKPQVSTAEKSGIKKDIGREEAI